MAGIHEIFNAALSGIKTNTKALEITGTNIANVNTEGYTKQTIVFQSSPTFEAGIGSGVSIGSLDRIYDHFVNKQLLDSIESNGMLEEQKRNLEEIQDIFDESGNTGLSSGIINFFNAWSSLSANPVSITERNNVLAAAQTLSDDFKSINDYLKELRYSLNSSVAPIVQDINTKIREIAEVNAKILSRGKDADNANELLDEREKLVGEIAKYGNVKILENDNAFQVLFANSVVVDNNNYSVLSTQGDAEGNVSIWLSSNETSTKTDISDRITTGRLAGIATTRDTYIPTYLQKLDKIAYTIMKETNEVHQTGFGLEGSTNKDFFKDFSAVNPAIPWDNASAIMTIDPWLQDNPHGIGAAPDLNQIPNGNAVALKMAGLATKDVFILGNVSFQNSYSTLLQQIGSDTNSMQRESAITDNFHTQLKIRREGISGVSMDQEAANLMLFQRAFQGSAKVLSVCAELLDTLVNI